MEILLPAVARFDAALRQCVDAAGRVDYAAFADNESLRQRVAELAMHDWDALRSRAEKLAFWINAYNTLVIASVVEAVRRDPNFRGVLGSDTWALWPLQRAKDLLAGARFFLRGHGVGGRKVSLYSIEHRILRGELREPRIHFALVCGAESCPPLRRGLYSAAHIDAELDNAARNFIGNPQFVLIERETHTVWLSAIFKWYRNDFERAAGSVLNYIAQYRSDDERAYLERHGAQAHLRYFKYNWTLNHASVQ